jgi:dUTP pyrophosphatase
VALYNHGDKDIIIEKGEPFAQGIFHQYLLVENDSPKEIHRNGGIGSTHNKN